MAHPWAISARQGGVATRNYAQLLSVALLAALFAEVVGQASVATPGITAGLPKPLVTCYFNGTADGCDGFLLPGMDASNNPSGFLPKFVVPDDTWSMAFNCMASGPAPLPLPTLAALSYGSGGPFAISLWFKWSNSSMGSNQFLYSQVPGYKLEGNLPSLDTPSGTTGATSSSTGKRRLSQVPQANSAAPTPAAVAPQGPPSRSSNTPTLRVAHIGSALSAVGTTALMPNQVQVFLPSGGDSADGVVRTLIRDSTDLGSAATFLDSDGMVNNFDGIRNDPFNKQVLEGEWHHLVISTLPQRGKKGYVIYMDGAPAAALSAASMPIATNSAANHISVTGGGPLSFAGGPVFLCQGADRVPESRFQGYISHLRIFNASVTASQVTSMYMDDVSSMTTDGQTKYTAQLSSRAASHTDSIAAALQPSGPGASSSTPSSGGTGATSSSTGGSPPLPSSAADLNPQQRQQADVVSDPTATAGSSVVGAVPSNGTDMSASNAAAAAPAATADAAAVFTLVNGEVSSGVQTQSGLWASLTAANPTYQAPSTSTASDLLFAACDGSANSALPMHLDMDQLLPVSGFAISAWLRAPQIAKLLTNPLPIFSVLTTQQATVASIMDAQARQEAAVQAAQAASAHSAGRQQPASTGQGRRRLQQAAAASAPATRQTDPTSSPDTLSGALIVPLSTHAYLAPATSILSNAASVNGTTASGNTTSALTVNSALAIYVAVNVAVIPTATASFPGGQSLQPFVETYQAVIPTGNVSDGAMHQLAVVAAPPEAGSTAGDQALAYYVYVDGQQQAAATASLSQPVTSSAPAASNTTSATASSAAADDWLLKRALPELQSLAATGSSGMLLACGSADSSPVPPLTFAPGSAGSLTSAAASGDAAASAQAHQRRLAAASSSVVVRRLDGVQPADAPAAVATPTTDQGTPGPAPEPPPAATVNPPLAPNPGADVLVTDVRLFQSPLSNAALHALYQSGPGASSVAEPAASAADMTARMSAAPSSAPTASQQANNVTNTVQPPGWIQVGTGFVPGRAAMDSEGGTSMSSMAPSQTIDLPSQGSSQQPATDGSGQQPIHVVTTVLPEDLANKTTLVAPHGVTTVLPEDLQRQQQQAQLGTGAGTRTPAAVTDGSGADHSGVVSAGHPMNVVLPEDLQGTTRLAADQGFSTTTAPSSDDNSSQRHTVALGVGLGVGLGGALLIAVGVVIIVRKKGQEWTSTSTKSVLSWIKDSGAARSQRSIASTIQLPVTTQHQLCPSSELLVRSIQDHTGSAINNTNVSIPGSCSLPVLPAAPAFAASMASTSYSAAGMSPAMPGTAPLRMNAMPAPSLATSSSVTSSPGSVITISPSLTTGPTVTPTIPPVQAPPASVLVLPSSAAAVSATGFLGSPSRVVKRTPRTSQPGGTSHATLWHNTIDEEDVPASAAEGSQRAKRSLESQQRPPLRNLINGGLRSSLQSPRPEPPFNTGGAPMSGTPATASITNAACGSSSGSSISLRHQSNSGLPVIPPILTPHRNRIGQLSSNAAGLCLSPRGNTTLPPSRMAPSRKGHDRASSFVSAGLSSLGMCIGGSAVDSPSVNEHLLASAMAGNSTGKTTQAAQAAAATNLRTGSASKAAQAAVSQKANGKQEQVARGLDGEGQVVVGGVDKPNLTHRHHNTAPGGDATKSTQT